MNNNLTNQPATTPQENANLFIDSSEMVNETLTEKKTTKINNKDIEINSIKVMPFKHASFNGCRLDFVRRGICRTLSNILDERGFFCENRSLSI